MKCCRNTPRCADCPARRIAEAKVLLALGIPPGPSLPPHLEGVPRSLHKYEPLLRKSWDERRRAERVVA